MKFSELKPGNLFRYAGNIYMKTKDLELHTDCTLIETTNTVRLKDREVSWFNDDADVTLVQQWTCNFIIKYKEAKE